MRHSRWLASLALWAGMTPAFGRDHWAFIPPVRASPPVVQTIGWARNPIDVFVLQRLEAAGLAPSPEVNRSTLLRRVSLDLVGLPPTPADVDAFLNDPRPDAYKRVVDRLLASPQYGERWGRHWLDIARYADSNGYSIDAPRSAWPWRDWVIAALNRDQPYSEFVVDQLAGDLRPHASLDQQVATGFHRNTQINEEGGIDPEQFRIEAVIDRVNTTGTAFLGLTVGCAQCHDHKFDPLSQREYYRLFAFFNTQEEPCVEVASPEEFAARESMRSIVRPLQNELDARAAQLTPGFAAWEAGLTPDSRGALPLDVRHVLGLLPEQRTEKQRTVVLQGFFETDAQYRSLQDQLQQAGRSAPRIPTTLVLTERAQPRPSFIFIKGDFTRPGEPVTPDTPRILPPLDRAPARKEARSRNEPNRLDLARWLVNPAHPLTARVMVNRIWQQYFGRGLVETENDFGTQGSHPTHPELLDWLATELSGARSANSPHPWSLKHLHRLIVTSATYRQQSAEDSAAPASGSRAVIDPLNHLLSRQNRIRLEGEIVRDVALATSGRLSQTLGGPPVFPPQPEGVMALGQSRREWKPSEGADRYRRGLYTFRWRATPHPALSVFDTPDAFSTCTRRLRSNTPLQALTLLNDEAFLDLAEGLADRLLREAASADRLDLAFRICLARPPAAAERQRLQSLLDVELREGDERTAWITLSRVLLNLDETITRE